MGLAQPSERHSPPATADIRRPRHVAICLTPHAFLPGACPDMGHESRWLIDWSVTAIKPLQRLANRLNRSVRSLTARDAPLSGDVEILARAPGFSEPVVMALIGYGLTYEDCAAALRELSR